MKSQNLLTIQDLQSQIELLKQASATIIPKAKPSTFIRFCNITVGFAILGSLGFVAWEAGAKQLFKNYTNKNIAFKEQQIEQNMRDISVDDQEKIAHVNGNAIAQVKYQKWIKSRKEDIDNTIHSAGKKILEYKCDWNIEDCSKYNHQPAQVWQPIPNNAPLSFLAPMPANNLAEGIIQKNMQHKRIVSLPAPPEYKPKVKHHQENDAMSDVLKEHQLKQVIAKAGE